MLWILPLLHLISQLPLYQRIQAICNHGYLTLRNMHTAKNDLLI